MNLFGHKPKQKQENMKVVECLISGMHCSSCAMNIDGALEDLPGVMSADTSYASATTTVRFDPTKSSQEQVLRTISEAGYHATVKPTDIVN